MEAIPIKIYGNKGNSKDIQKELKSELEELRRFLNYKNSKICKSKLDSILNNYFGEKNEQSTEIK